MTVDQPRADTSLMRVDDAQSVFEVAVLGLAERDDEAVVDDNRVGVKNGLVDVA